MSELMLVSVPGVRLDADGALLRVLLVPRLSGGGGTLASYGLANWPQRLTESASPMVVRLRTAAGQDLPPVEAEVRDDAQPEVWKQFFGRITVTPYAGTATYPRTSVTPTGQHARDVDDAYQATVQAVGDPATVDAQLDALHFQAAPPEPDANAPVPTATDPDFHRVVALMRQHPVVLRALGLVVDLRVPRASITACGASGEVAVEWPLVPVTFSEVTSPRTAFVVRQGRFLAAPSTAVVAGATTVVGTVVDGMVDLTRTSEFPDPLTGETTTRPDWAIHTFDVDAAVARLADAKLASARRRRRTDHSAGVPDPDAPSGAVMPALRTVGLQLVHRRRGDWYADRQARAERNAGAARRARGGVSALPVLTADDLVLGYRLDVRYSGSDWHSMMRRSAHYTVNDLTIGPDRILEEGHLLAAAGVKGTGDEVYADGVVARWEGHRLSLPRPPLDGGPARAAVVHDAPYRFAWEFGTDDTEPLARPELRFGNGYQMRLRVVDLAGGGLGVADVAGDTAASELITYARHEPVLPPEMPPPAGLLEVATDDQGRRRPTVDPDLLGPGGSLTRLVVRSDPAGATPATVADLAASYPANDSRLLLPPATTFTLSEWDDRLNGVGPETWRLVRRARAVPRSSEAPQAGRHYTWVPDPGADSVSLTTRPVTRRLAQSGPSLADWDTAAWPDHAPKQVRVIGVEPGAITEPRVNWESAVRGEVRVPPAGRAILEVSSAVEAQYFQRFAASAWAPVDSSAQRAVVTGRHPVVTPALRLEVVHAVRAPLGKPAGTLEAVRSEGDLAAELVDKGNPRLGIDRDSTAQVDVAASWQEWADPGPAAPPDAPVSSPIVQSVGSFPVDLDAAVLLPIIHRFGDTRHRLVTYRFAAHSRFREFFAATDPESAFVREAELAPVHVPSTVRPNAPVVLAVTPASRTDVGVELGTAFVDEPVDPDDVDADGIPDDIDGFVDTPILGIPIGVTTMTPVVTREGGILRVELAAPWFTTGDGEQLGVVVSPGPDAANLPREAGADGEIAATDNAHASLVTRAYRDPLMATTAPTQPTAASLTHTAGDPLVVRDHESGVPICVVPFDVVRVGGRWFADIGFGGLADASAPPFVRLTLVRFQRHSLRTITTSPTVSTDLMVLLPGRTLRVDNLDPADGGRPVVTLSGLVGAGAVEMRLEAAASGIPSDGLTSLDPTVPGWTTVWRVSGSLNVPFGAFEVPNDGLRHRLVVREYDALPARNGPAPAGVLEQEGSRLPVFVGVVAV